MIFYIIVNYIIFKRKKIYEAFVTFTIFLYNFKISEIDKHILI